MAEVKSYDNYTLTAGGGTINLGSPVDSLEDSVLYSAQLYYVNGSATLGASYTIQQSGTMLQGLVYKVIYNATMTLGGNTITIFGVSLTADQAQSKCVITAYYNGSAIVTNISQSDDTKITFNDGVTTTALTAGGGTITLTPKTDKSYLYLNGSATLAGNWVVTGAGTAVEHSFIVNYASTLIAGVNSVTIFGVVLSTSETLGGGVTVLATYDTTNSTYRVTKIPSNTPNTIYSCKAIYVDTVYGNDSSGAAFRQDLPYLTYAAARAAAVALTPIVTTNRIWVVGRGYTNEQIVFANGVDWFLGGCVLDLQAGAGLSTFDDAGIACDSKVYGNPTVYRSGTGTTPVACIKTSNAGSNVTAYLGDLINSTTGASDGAILTTAGTLTVYCNNITAYNYSIGASGGTQTVWCKNAISSNNSTVVNAGGTQIVNGVNITSSAKACIANTSGSQVVYCNDVVSSGADAAGDTINTSGGTQSVFCNNVTQNNALAQVVYQSGSGTQIIRAKGTILGSSYIGAIVAENQTGTMDIEANLIQAGAIVINPLSTCTGTVRIKGRIKNTGTGTAVDVQSGAASLFTLSTPQCETTNGDVFTCATANDTAVIRIQGRFVAGGANKKGIISGGGAAAPELVIEGMSTIVNTGTGEPIYSADAATTVKVNVGSQGGGLSATAVSANITQQVSTLTISANAI